MSAEAEVRRYAAFTDTPAGGNPAGVVLDAAGLGDTEMLAIAADVGYSETAFLRQRPEAPHQFDVRYFSPEAEVPFCGHATIAAAVALADRDGPGELVFNVGAGPVAVRTGSDSSGVMTASLTSVGTHIEDADEVLLGSTLAALGWPATELDPTLPPRIAYAGAHHLILAAAARERLAKLEYDFDRLKELMLAADLTTVDLVWRERDDLYHVRNPFPVGGVYEDPATGAAAAAFGGYLRSLGLVSPPARVTLLQGHDMGRPSLLILDIPAGDRGVTVTGRAVPIT
jgi:PhzF family phenazine biosynthesis protein